MEGPRVLDVSGSAHERGRAHGEALRGEIAHGLARMHERSRNSQPAETGPYLAAAGEWTPDVVSELRGIAAGAAVSFDEILTFNLADELGVFDGAERCSCIGIQTAAGGVISGQTMDTPRWFAETRVAIRSAERETGLSTLAFTIAGMPALCGVNSAGVGVWCNALYQLPPSHGGVPVACITRHLLSSGSLAAAAEFLDRVPHATGQHYLVAGRKGFSSRECSALGASTVTRKSPETAWHTNHPVATEGDYEAAPSSVARDGFIAASIGSARTVADVRAILGDRTAPVSKTGENAYSLWAVVAEHATPPVVAATAGPPGESPWTEIAVVPDAQR